MKTTSISNVQENLGALLDQVRRGETFMILDQDKPVARLEPVGTAELAGLDRARLELLVDEGLIQPAQKALNMDNLPDPVIPLKQANAVGALLADREGL